MSEAAVPALRGRPPDEAKRDAILDAATAEFMARGYAAASIERVAAAAGVSKVTIYNRFGGKERLFADAVAARCEAMRAALDLDVEAGLPLRETLVNVGCRMNAFLSSPTMVAFERRLAADAARDPAIGALFLDAGPRRMKAALTGIVARAAERGEVQLDDPALIAELLACAIKGFADLERRFGQFEPDAEARARARVEAAVDLFLVALRPR